MGQTEATKTKKPTGKKAREEQRRRDEAAALDKENQKAAGEQRDLKVLQVLDLDPSKLVFRPDIQGRYKEVDNERVLDLADSMRTNGQLSPIQVRATGENDEYDVIYGNTRAKAGQYIVAGYPSYGLNETPITVPANPGWTIRAEVVECSDEEAVKRNIAENNDRSDCTTIDHMHNQERLRQLGMTDAEIARQYGYSGSALVFRYKKLLQLTPDIKDMIHGGELTAAAGFLLSDLPPEVQTKVVEFAREEDLKKYEKLSKDEKAERQYTTDHRGRLGETAIKGALRVVRSVTKADTVTSDGSDEGKPATGGGEGNTEAGASGTAASAPAKDKTFHLTVKQVKEELRRLESHERTGDRVKTCVATFLDFMEGRIELRDLSVYLADAFEEPPTDLEEPQTPEEVVQETA